MKTPQLITLRADDIGLVIRASTIGGSFRHSKSAVYNREQILHRSSGVVNHSHSENERVSFNFKLVAFNDAWSEVVVPIKQMKSLVIPKAPGSKTPPVCYLTGFDLFTDWMCVVEEISFEYPDEIWSPEGHPMTAVVSLSLLEVDINNIAAERASEEVFAPFSTYALYGN